MGKWIENEVDRFISQHLNKRIPTKPSEFSAAAELADCRLREIGVEHIANAIERMANAIEHITNIPSSTINSDQRTTAEE